jgi:homoserine dehydrogenase
VQPERIHTEGIRHISKLDMQFAALLGYDIKLLGVVKRGENAATERGGKSRLKSEIPNLKSQIQVSVYPTLVPQSHVLANVSGVFNAVLVRGDVVGDTLYYGRGAGQDATASAVLSDLADAALDLKFGTHSRVPPFVHHERSGSVLPMDDVVSRYYVRLAVEDRPGVFARIAGILAKAKIGISSIIQPEGHAGATVPVILMIHDATNSAMKRALAQIAKLPVVKAAPVMLRVESFE